jgi:regulator of sirC expression with transglutaminase-like and TPR domain
MQLAPTSALDYFAMLVAEDRGFALTEAAVSIAQDEHPRLDTQSVLAEIDALAGKLRERIPADCAPVQRLRFLQRYFYSELGFAGNVNDYYSPHNSHVHEVLRTRRGIPITLAVIYLEIAHQVGLAAQGVSFPGHFLVKLKLPAGEVVLDPLTGQSLSREDLEERLAPYRRRAGLVGDMEVPLGLFLRAAEPREVIARMLRNLQEIHRDAEDWPRLLQVQDRMVRLLPDDWLSHRDRGLTLLELARNDEAIEELSLYLGHVPDAPDHGEIAERVQRLRSTGSTRWH